MKPAQSHGESDFLHYSSLLQDFLAFRGTGSHRGNGPGQTKEYFSGKTGGPIVVTRRAGHNFTLAQLLLWYFVNDMIVVGSTYRNIGVAGSGKHDIEVDTEGIDTVRHFAKSMSILMKKIYG